MLRQLQQVFILLLSVTIRNNAMLKTRQVVRKLHTRALFMATTDQPQWHKTSIISNVPEAIGLQKIQIKTNPTVVASYLLPGQYVQIRPNEATKPGFYAIASPPVQSGDDIFTFLIKETENNQYLSKASTGTTVEMSLAQGKGFPIAEYFQKYKFDFPVTNIVMMACGSGLAPIAATIDSDLLGLGKSNFNSLFKAKATLYLGCRTLDHIPMKDRIEQWSNMGVKIVPVLSQQGGDSYNGRRGYIQDALREDGVAVPRNTGALLCGQRGMVEDVKKQFLEAGVFEGRVLLNF